MKLLVFLTAGFLAVGTTRAADLVDVYRQALNNDPTLLEAAATRSAALEAKPQALAALLPQLTGDGLATREHDTGSTDTVEGVSGLSAGQTISFPFQGHVNTHAETYGVNLRLSVFSWANWVALRSADKQVAQAEADYQVARQEMAAQVVQRYFNVLAAQDDLDAKQGALVSVDRQLEQAEKRYAVGLNASTDVVQAKAARYSAAAAVVDAKRQLASTQKLLSQITGRSFDELAVPAEPFRVESPEPRSEDEWVNIAMVQNLALISSRLAADVSREAINQASAGHLPTLSLVAGRNKNNNDAASFYTNGGLYGTQTLNETQTTVGLQVTVPLYSGGAVSSQVRQAEFQHIAAKERLERVSRQTEFDARDAYLGVTAEIARVESLKQALESSETTLEATEVGYEAGARTSVDLLVARRDWLAARADYSRSRYDYLLNMAKLQEAAGTLSERSVVHINEWLTSAPKDKAPAQERQNR